MENVLGVLLNQRNLEIYGKSRSRRASLELYQNYGNALGVRVGFFTVDDVNLPDGKVNVHFLKKGLEMGSTIIPIPHVIYNRSIHTKMNDIRKIRKLRMMENVILYNPICSQKWEYIFRMLKTEPELDPYLTLKRAIPSTYHNQPFSLCVSMQKDGHGRWSNSGIVGRVFYKDYYPSMKMMQNVALAKMNGGLSVDLTTERLNLLNKVSMQAAETLEKYLPQLFEVCFHFILSDEGEIQLFRTDLMDQKLWYKKASDQIMWETNHRKPIEYGLLLLNRSIGSEEYEFSNVSS